MEKRSGKGKVRLVPQLSSYHSELQKRVAIVGVSLVIILILVGVGLYVAPDRFVGKAISIEVPTQYNSGHGGHDDITDTDDTEVETQIWDGNEFHGPGDQTTAHCPDRNYCVIEDAWCFPVGSIAIENTPNDNWLYCSPSLQSRLNVWVACEGRTASELTADHRFICVAASNSEIGEWTPCIDDNAGERVGSFYCDGQRWNACDDTQSGGSEYICEGDAVHQCTDEDENEVQGNFRCNGEIWEQCGDETAYICQGYDEPQECNDATKYTRENQNNQDGSTHLANIYYCSYNPSVPQSYMWVECTDDTLGEGVDNALHADRYNDNYVCVTDAARNNARTWLPIPNCQACARDLEGSCVGSSKIDVRTGNGQVHYYRSTNIDTRIGCAGENQCFHNGLEMDVDEAFVSRTAVCGNHNFFLGCTDGTVAVASDGSHWLCAVHPDDNEDGDGIWLECTESNSGVQFDNFICSYNAGEREWQWYSEFSCSPNQKYQVRDREAPGTDRICDGANWITCADLAVRNPFIEPGANVTCNGAQFSVKELICNNDHDDDKDGRVDCDDRTQCSSNIPSILNENNLYEVILKKGDCFTTNIMVRVSGFLRNVYSQLHVCDLGTEAFGNRVTLCDETGPILTLDSTTLLRNRFGQPYADDNDLAFLFKEGTPKTVSVMLSRDISETALELPLETFAPNVAAGQRVMLSVDGESYLLWHPTVTANVSFSEANLKLTHIATNAIIPAFVYPGTNRYTFDLVGDRLMTFLIDTPLVDPENQIFRIEALAPGEAPQSFPVPTNLAERFEVTFSKANPVRFINPADVGLGTFSVCRDDNSADPQQVKVCRNNDFDNLGFTLRARNLTKREVEGKNYAFLFEVVNNTKQVSLFQLTTLSSTISDLTYDPFINAMVAGRRVAVEFENKLYLLRHPMQPFISLPSITVTRYVGDVTTTFPAIGSQDLIDFLIPDGKVSLQRKYGDPPPPFQISALRTEEIAPVDLDLHLSTSMSSLVPVTVNGNIIAAADSVYRLDEQVFNIGIGGIGELLRLRVPAAIGGNALFYYHTVTPSEGALLKQVSIFKLYNLSTATPTQSRSYNAEFVEQFAGGKQFAILLGGQYYLFSYENNNNEVRSFNINRVRLSTLDRVTTFVAIPDGAGVRFDLPDGKRVRIQVNYVDGTLEMQTGLELLTETLFTGYMTELNPGNEVQIGATKLRLCFLTAYALQPAARVCSAVVPSIDVLANPSVVVAISGENYFLESNGQTGNNKKVFIRKLYSLPAGIPVTFADWFNFIGEVVAHREPYFQVDDQSYVPSASDGRLETFRLKQYPDGAQQAPRNVQVKTPITADGSIVLHDRVVLIEQQETTDEEVPVEATFTTQNYHYLPDNHDVIRFNSTGTQSLPFVVVVDGTQYTLGTSVPITSLVRLSLTAGPNTLLNRLFASGETRVLNLEGTSVEIKVEVIGPKDGTLNAQITVKRR